jgi:hypothetical protein
MSTHSYSSPGTASGLLLDNDMSAGSAAGNLGCVATVAFCAFVTTARDVDLGRRREMEKRGQLFLTWARADQ